MYHDFRVAFHQNVQFRIIVRTRILASRVEGSFGGDGGAGGFENFGDIGTIGNSPTSFLWRGISMTPYGKGGRTYEGNR